MATNETVSVNQGETSPQSEVWAIEARDRARYELGTVGMRALGTDRIVQVPRGIIRLAAQNGAVFTGNENL